MTRGDSVCPRLRCILRTASAQIHERFAPSMRTGISASMDLDIVVIHVAVSGETDIALAHHAHEMLTCGYEADAA